MEHGPRLLAVEGPIVRCYRFGGPLHSVQPERIRRVACLATASRARVRCGAEQVAVVSRCRAAASTTE
jgi:hypothetical protein